MTFRILALKSKLQFGKFASYTVGDCLVMGKYEYLIWVYYHMSHISFNDEILNSLHISSSNRITKPGIDDLKFHVAIKDYYAAKNAIERPQLEKAIETHDWVTYHNLRGTRAKRFNKIKDVNKERQTNSFYSKQRIQGFNHSHKYIP